MRRSALVSIGAAIGILLACSTANAQPPTPGPEQKKLEVALGSWTYVAEMKATVLGPASTFTGVEKYQWTPGGFYLQMDRTAKTPQGAFHHLLYFGYDAVTKKHTAQWFDLTAGGSASATIVVAGNTWNWSGVGHTGDGKSYQERCTITFATSGSTHTVKCDVSTDGKTWAPSYEAKATKAK